MRQLMLFEEFEQTDVVQPQKEVMKLSCWSRLLLNNTKSRNLCIHFYEDDRYFNSILTRYSQTQNYLKRFSWVISPDFSLYSDMPKAEIIHNSFKNKIICANWQKNGLNVIPNVSWAKPNTYDFCFDGFPRNSIIAINSTGCSKNRSSQMLWYKGYEEAINRLSPAHIIRYGAKMKGENESISTYFNNDNQNMTLWEEMDLFQK